MMTWIVIGLLICSQIASMIGLSLWTSAENRAPVMMQYAILMVLHAIAVTILMK